MGKFIAVADVPEFVQADSWRIDDAEALALLAAPCLSGDLSADQLAAVKAVLRQALIRWRDSGSGAVTSETAGPFSQTIDTRTQRRGMFWPSELDMLREICGSGSTSPAFQVDTTPAAAASGYWAAPDQWVAL